jgi:hypothetical protein
MRRDTSSATRAAEAASQAARQALAATDETSTAVDNLRAKQDELAEKLEQLQARTAALEAGPAGSAAPSESGFSAIDAGSGGTRGTHTPAPVGAWLPLTIIIGGFPKLAEEILKGRVEKMVEAVPSRIRARVSHVYTNSVMDFKAFIKLKGCGDEETLEVVRALRGNCPELADGALEGLWCSRAKTPQKVAEGAKLRELTKALVSLVPPTKAANIKSDPRKARVILAPDGETLARVPVGEQQLQIRYDYINEKLGVAKGGLDKAMAALQEERRWG